MKNWPTLLALVATALIGALSIFHVITPEQAAGLGTLMVPFTAYVHRMDPPSSGTPSGGAAAGAAITGLALLALAGCASIGHWSPAALPEVAVLCTISGEVQPQLDALAIKYGVPVSYVEEAFKLACAETAKTAPSEAKHAGLSAARAGAHAARMARAKFETDGGAP